MQQVAAPGVESEIARLERELAAAVARQAASDEVLRVISASAGKLEPVFDTMLGNAVRICEASYGVLFRYQEGMIRAEAMLGVPPAFAEFWQRGAQSPGSGTAFDSVVRTKQPVHVIDVTREAAYVRGEAVFVAAADLGGFRTFLNVPLLKDDALIGVVSIYRTEVRPFTGEQIALVASFARQAVIAIENARLLEEADARRREAQQALEYQTAISDVLNVISRSPSDVQPVLEAIAETAQRLCGAEQSYVMKLENGGYVPAAGKDVQPERIHYLRAHPVANDRGSVCGRAALEGRPVHIVDAIADPEYTLPAAGDPSGFRTLLGVPLLRDGIAIGVIVLTHAVVRPFTDKQIELITTFADQALIAIENVRLFEAEQARSRELSESLAQQTATADVLKVISRSTFDLRSVLDTLVESATRVCDADHGQMFQRDGNVLHWAAGFGLEVEVQERLKEFFKAKPLPLDRTSISGRAALSGGVVQVSDVLAEPESTWAAPQQIAGYRSALGVPLLRGTDVIGVFFVSKRLPQPFSAKEIELVTTFADQAVIAIENTRLLNELRDSLAQQTATAEVLQVISTSAGELAPVFDAMLENATNICEASYGVMWLREADGFRMAALHGALPAEQWKKGAIYRPSKDVPLARVVESRQPVHVPDMREERAYREGDPLPRAAVEVAGMRTLLAVPMLKDNDVVGGIGIYRTEVRPFSGKQIELVANFASQAVIAIENTRLLKELRDSLAQQTATAEVLQVISSSPGDLEPVFETMLENAVRICAAKFGLMWLSEGGGFRSVAMYGVPPALAGERSREPIIRPGPEIPLGRLAVTKEVLQILDITAEAGYRDSFEPLVALADIGGARTLLLVPLLKDAELMGAIAIYRPEVRLFSEKQIALVQNFAAQAVIAIENTRLLRELRQRTGDLSEALEQQTATSNVLEVISRSAFNLQPVFDTVAESAARLCGADRAFIFQYDGALLQMVAGFNAPPEFRQWVANNPIRPGRHSGSARAALERRTIHIPDVLADPEYTYGAKSVENIRTILGVPILKGDELLGVIMIYRFEVRPFSDKQIALVETFADQAAIAIENVRLFDELRTRTDELSKSLQQQTATADVLRVISRSTFDLQTVLETLAESAARLCDADTTWLFRREGDGFRFAASYGYSQEEYPRLRDYFKEQLVKPGRGSLIGRTALEGKPTHIADVFADPDYTWSEAQQLGHYRTTFGVPVLREGVTIGVMALTRSQVRPFSEKQIELATSFADQAGIAIENVRLFKEIQDKSRQLEEASKHKSQFLASMSHELRTPLNAIIGVTEMLVEDAHEFKRDDELEPLGRVLRAAKHLLALINDILDLSKIEAGRMELQLEPFPLAPLIDDVAQTIEPIAGKNGNRLVVDCAPDLGIIHADQIRVRQVLLNLASNAGKFTEHGTITISAQPQRQEGRERIDIAVTDTGIGLTEEQIGRLFQHFSQADASTTRKYGGTGLGLAISRHFCRMMGGDITVTSKAGVGSTFTVSLPRRVESGAAAAPVPALASRTEPSPTTLDEEPLILVVDDDATVRDVVARHLERAGFAVVGARGGAEGLRLTRELRPAAVTLDIMMPDLDGWTVLAAIKGDPDLAATPVVLMSIVEEKNRGYALGAADYLVKPVDRGKLVETLRAVCGGSVGRLLLVDDDDLVRRGVRAALQPVGWEVLEAEDGAVALDALARFRPHAIILDLMMPRMDGFAFLEALRSRPEARDIPVVVITAKDLTPAERERLNGGVARVIAKSDRDAMLSQLAAELKRCVKVGPGKTQSVHDGGPALTGRA
ncbi:MAG: GAF domain-containing protein [Xanthobacteraceae bacterium]